MKRAGSTDPAKFLPEVGKTNYQGVIGPIAFDEKGDLRNGPITIYVVKGSNWASLETVTPGASAQASAGGTAAASPAGASATASGGGSAAAASGQGATATAPAPSADKK
jgi:branched-chain amino acid transport system substrate-binding protein